MNSPSDKRKKQSPFKRQKDAKPTLIREPDRAILRWVYRRRMLSTDQISQLTGRSKNYLTKRLRSLYHNHYLDRHFIPLTFGQATILYTLGREGKKELIKEQIEDFRSIPKKDASGFFREHLMEINDVFALLHLACQARGLSLTKWIGEYQFKTDYDHVSVSGYDRKLPIQPDAFFTIHDPAKVTPKNQGNSHFFLELDRGTMASKHFKKKIVAYSAYYRGGGYTKRFEHKSFRVLTVVTTKTDERVKTLLATSKQVKQIGKRFWFAHKDDLTPDNILSSDVWRIAGSEENGVIFK